MRTCHNVFVWIAIVAAFSTALSADDKKKPPEEKKKAPEAEKEQSVVEHKSKTHGAVLVTSVSKNPGDWYDVLKDGERAISGNPPLLTTETELEPGSYVVDVNRTRRKVAIEIGKKTILRTGELVVEGKGASWYIPYQGKDRKLVSNPPILGTATALFPGKYSVFVFVDTEEKRLGDAEVKPNRKTVLKY